MEAVRFHRQARRRNNMATASNPDFEKNVFINCPFDSAYNSLLRPLLFTIIYFGLAPTENHSRLIELENFLTGLSKSKSTVSL